MSQAETQFKQDYRSSKKALDVGACMQHARNKFGKSLFSQIREIYSLSRADGKLNSQEYYYFNLYDDRKFPFGEKVRFLSDRIHGAVIRKCCDVHWWATADDKFIAYTLLEACGAPIPRTRAVFCRTPRSFGRLRKLADAEQLAAFLANPDHYPLFAKPIEGIGSFGAYLLRGYAGGELQLHDGSTMPIADFIAKLDADQGYLLQEALEPHPSLRQFGEYASTVRVIVIIDQGRPEILHTVWKIPANNNFADNFWRDKNLLAAIDPKTGTVERAIRGVGPALEEIETHPDTGARLKGFVLPDWRRLVDLCLESAGIFSQIRYQSWDIAMCPEGPVVIEVNTGSAFNLSQLAEGKGFLDERFGAFLKNNGYNLKLRH